MNSQLEPKNDEPGCGAVIAILLLVGMIFWIAFCIRAGVDRFDERLKTIEEKLEQKK